MGLAESIQSWSNKGEITAGYLNPGDFFDEIHILSATAGQEPLDLEILRTLCGSAAVHFHHFATGPGLVAQTWGWRERRFATWVARAQAILEDARVSLFRSFSAHINSVFLLAAHRSGIPTILSLHASPDLDSLTSATSLRNHAGEVLIQSLRNKAVRTAECVVGVYSSIEPYARRLGAQRYLTIPNVVGQTIVPKSNWTTHDQLRVCSVGRLHPSKDPTALVRSVLGNPSVSLTLVGDGPLRDRVEALAAGSPNVALLRSVPNEKWCRELVKFDAFAGVNFQHGMPKAVMEAALAGLPIVINREPNERYREFDDSYCTYIDGSSAGFANALNSLWLDDHLRRRKGELALKWARERWSPSSVTTAWTDLYREVIAEG